MPASQILAFIEVKSPGAKPRPGNREPSLAGVAAAVADKDRRHGDRELFDDHLKERVEAPPVQIRRAHPGISLVVLWWAGASTHVRHRAGRWMGISRQRQRQRRRREQRRDEWQRQPWRSLREMRRDPAAVGVFQDAVEQRP